MSRAKVLSKVTAIIGFGSLLTSACFGSSLQANRLNDQNIFGSNKEMNKTEMHYSICEPSTEDILRKIKMSESDFKFEELEGYYFDTEKLDQLANGVVLRLRIPKDKKPAESTVKVRYSVDREIPGEWLDKEGFKCEQDYYKDSKVVNCSLVEPVVDNNVKKFLHDNTKVSEVFTHKQEKFVHDFNGEELVFTHLKTFGPVRDVRLSFKKGPPDMLEVIHTQKGAMLAEFSQRVPTSDVDAEYPKTLDFILKSGVNLCPEQKSKTRQILEGGAL